MHYNSFNGAYADETTPKVERASYDIPTDPNQWREIISRTPVIVLYMWSDTCRPCHMIRDKFEMMAHRFQNEDVLFFKDNIDLPTSFHRNQVEVVPTFFILCDGTELDHPQFKSVYNGWTEQMKDSIQYHISQSQRLIEKQQMQQQQQLHQQEQEHQQKSSPQLYCYNNVCYLKKD